MPNTRSAAKQVRVSKRRHLQNRSVRSQVKTGITRAETVIASGGAEAAREAVVAAITSLDKAAEKRVIHPSNAARRKSRLMKKLNRVQSASAAPKPEPAG